MNLRYGDVEVGVLVDGWVDANNLIYYYNTHKAILGFDSGVTSSLLTASGSPFLANDLHVKFTTRSPRWSGNEAASTTATGIDWS